MANVLIVEDEIFIREMAMIFVAEFGHQIHCAGDVDEARAILESEQNLDLLFTDLRLKTAIHGGFEIAKEAVNSRPNLRVLYTSGQDLSEEMMAMCVPGSQFIQKPYSENDLQRRIDSLLAMSI